MRLAGRDGLLVDGGVLGDRDKEGVEEVRDALVELDIDDGALFVSKASCWFLWFKTSFGPFVCLSSCEMTWRRTRPDVRFSPTTRHNAVGRG